MVGAGAKKDYTGALLLVTHDRSFLENVANEIAEIDRGKLYHFVGSYQRFLRFREEQLAEGQPTTVRQKACRGRGLDSPGHQSAPLAMKAKCVR